MNTEETRRFIAAEAAKLLAQQQTLDYAWARHKAAQSAGVRGERNLPDFALIEASLTSYLELFHPGRNDLQQLQTKSLKLMELLSAFQPHLCGPLTRGIAVRFASVSLYLYSDSAKDVLFRLMDLNANFESLDVKLSFQRGTEESRPAFRINFDDTEYVLMVLQPGDQRHPPTDPVTGKADRGLSLKALQKMIEKEVGSMQSSVGRKT
ncbi:MAG: hypothetical protein U9Q75_08395 [Pseudomonadota bacterium]|nr:hypothetical protein [Pseudomonadota bacterium]